MNPWQERERDSILHSPYNSALIEATITGPGSNHQIQNQWKYNMRLIIRYFFKAVHTIVGPILLAADWLTAPRGIKRTPEEQLRIDEQTKNLVLYQFLTCPFCIKARRAIKRLSLNIETRDALRHAPSRQQLLEGGGEIKVPCLRIRGEGGRVEWLYESNEIIKYLEALITDGQAAS